MGFRGKDEFNSRVFGLIRNPKGTSEDREQVGGIFNYDGGLRRS
jgi:hypothetical protein